MPPTIFRCFLKRSAMPTPIKMAMTAITPKITFTLIGCTEGLSLCKYELKLNWLLLEENEKLNGKTKTRKENPILDKVFFIRTLSVYSAFDLF